MKLLPLIFLGALVYTEASSQTVATSFTKTNVFYQYINNPLTVAVENCPCENIVMQASSGTLSGSGCQYIFKAGDKVFATTIKVGKKIVGGVKWLNETTYRVWHVPEPVLVMGKEKSGGTISKDALLAIGSIKMQCPELDLYECPQIISYSLAIITKDTTFFVKNISGNHLTPETIEFISKKGHVGNVLAFDDIQCVFEKRARTLPPFIITIAPLSIN